MKDEQIYRLSEKYALPLNEVTEVAEWAADKIKETIYNENELHVFVEAILSLSATHQMSVADAARILYKGAKKEENQVKQFMEKLKESKGMKIYIASSWKNKHAVEMLTGLLRSEEHGEHKVLSFVENNNDEQGVATDVEWYSTLMAERSFQFDMNACKTCDLVIYLSPAGTDAWAEVGVAWASNVPLYGLWAKGEPVGLMRKMMNEWFTTYSELLERVEELANALHLVKSDRDFRNK